MHKEISATDAVLRRDIIGKQSLVPLHPPICLMVQQPRYVTRVLCSASSLIVNLFKLLCSLQETCIIVLKPIPVAAWSKTWVYCRSLVGIAGLNPAGGVGFF